MDKKSIPLTIAYVVITSVTVLVVLSTSFDHFEQKYMPSFLLAQKYALPLILSAMAIVYLTFFEPERLSQKNPITFMRVLMIATFAIFSYFLATLDMSDVSIVTLSIYFLQWVALLTETVYFFTLKNSKAAS
ncbi:MAG: hypothetical protein WCW35_14775 [Bacteroidota bacterium]|jgi:hypothetical protein